MHVEIIETETLEVHQLVDEHNQIEMSLHIIVEEYRWMLLEIEAIEGGRIIEEMEMEEEEK